VTVSRESGKRPYIRYRGFTLVEMLVVMAIAALLIGGIVQLLTQFRRGFSKGEETGVALQEAGLFLAMLRNDLINAVPDRSLPPERRHESIRVTPTDISFSVYTGDRDRTARITYSYQPADARGSISRTIDGERPRILVNGRVASLTWELCTEPIFSSRPGSGTRCLWLDIQAHIGGQGKAGVKGRELLLTTKLFPVRLIRQLN